MARSWGYSTAAPPQPRYIAPDPAAPGTAPGKLVINPAGFYSGVSLSGAGEPVVAAPPASNNQNALLTWTGFERHAGAAKIFFQVSGAIDYVVQPNGNVVEIRLRNVRPAAKNNLRSLDLRFFETPVRGVELTRRGKDVVAKFVLKKPAELRVEIAEGKDGYKLLVVTPVAKPQT